MSLGRVSDTSANAAAELQALLDSAASDGAYGPWLEVSLKGETRDYRGRPTTTLSLWRVGPGQAPQPAGSAVRLDDLYALLDPPLVTEAQGASEAEIARYLRHTLLCSGGSAPGTEVLIHAVVTAHVVLVCRPDAVLALTHTPQSERRVRQALGNDGQWLPFQGSAFDTAWALSEALPLADPVWHRPGWLVVEKQGLIAWGATAQEAQAAALEAIHCVAAALDGAGEGLTQGLAQGPESGAPGTATLAESARRYLELAPVIRGLAARTQPDGTVLPGEPGAGTERVGALGRVVLHRIATPGVLAVLERPGAPTLLKQVAASDDWQPTRLPTLFVTLPEPGASTGQAIAGSAPHPLAASASAAGDETVSGQGGANGDTAALGALGAAWQTAGTRPQVLAIPGVGLIGLGYRPATARRQAEAVQRALRATATAEALGGYEPARLAEADTSLPAPAGELTGRVALVTGAAGGIGKAIAERLCREGAAVVVCDVQLEGAERVVSALEAQYGVGRALAVRCDVASEADVAALFRATIAAFGGLDILVSNAGIAPHGLLDTLSLSDWQRSLDINATGHFLVTREALRLMKQQGIGGSLIFITTKNVMAPGKEFGAYSAAKSAQAQLARVAALEGGEYGIRVNMINPDAVFRGSNLWSAELRRSRAEAHGTTEAGLEEYYRKRNLLGVPIYAEDVAEAAWWLASDRSAKTSGTVITVDGGVAAAFPR